MRVAMAAAMVMLAGGCDNEPKYSNRLPDVPIAKPTADQVSADVPKPEKSPAEKAAHDDFELAAFENAEEALDKAMEAKGLVPDYFAAHTFIHREGLWAAVRVQGRAEDGRYPREERCIVMRLDSDWNVDRPLLEKGKRDGLIPKGGVFECPDYLLGDGMKRRARKAGMPWK